MRWLVPVLCLVVLAAAACGDDDAIVSQNVVSAIPWTAPETATYRILNDDKTVGSAELRIEKQDASLKLTQEFNFPEKQFTNKAEVVVDAGSLRPQSARFAIDGPSGKLNCEAQYSGACVEVHRKGEDTERTDSLDVPIGSYDSWADLFLWRALALADGYETRYSDILSCTLDKTQNLGVTLKVKGGETIRVPAGTFDAWRLEVRSGGQTQTVWYGVETPHRLIRYDNGTDLFELEPPG